MRGKALLFLAVVLALVALLAYFWPLDRTPPEVAIEPAPGRYSEQIEVSMASEKGASIYFALGQEQPIPYTSPFRLKRDTVVRYYAVDRFGNRSEEMSAEYTLRLDTTPPETVASPRGGKFFHPVSVRLQTEEGAVVYYTTDGTDPSEASLRYTDPVALRQDTELRFFGVDEAGNREEARRESYAIRVDKAKPVTLAEPSGGLFNAPVSVKLSAEEGSTIYYTLDGSRPTARSKKYGVPLRFVRSGVLRFFAVDEAGNQEDVREESYVIDTEPPSVRVQPGGGAFPSPVRVALKSSERGPIYYDTGGQEPGLSSSVYSAPIPITRSTVLSFFAMDAAGNRSPVSQVEYVIDTVAPEAVTRPPGGSYSGRIRVKIETSEPAEVYFTLDGSAPSERSSRYEGPISIEQNTVLSYMAVDGVGNRSQPASQRYVLDATAPVTTADPPGGTFSGGISLTLSSEEGAVIRYSLDGSPPTESSPRYSAPLRLGKDTVVQFYATDASGNREQVRVERYTFDTKAPTTSVDPEPGHYGRPVSVTLSSEQGGRIFVRRAAQADYSTYSGPFVVDRTEKISFYAVDDAGNREPAQVAEYVIDTVPPQTVPYPAPGEYNPPIVLELRSEEGARIHYTLDGTEPSEKSPLYTAPISLSDDATIRFFAVDRAGNRERSRRASYRVASGLWRDNTNGVFIHPSVIDGDLLWVGGEEGLFSVNIDTKRRKNYTTSSGLISNSVRAIAVDRLGFKWIGTDKGVSQFDGARNWVTFDYSDGLPSNVINGVVIDPMDSIWFCTDRGLALYDRKRFLVRTTDDGLPDNNVTSLAIDADGVFWIGTVKGLLRQEGRAAKVFTTADGLPSDHVLSVAVDGRWNIWVGTRSGAARFDGRKWTRFTDAQGLPAVPVKVIAVDLADNKWFGTESGVYKYDGRAFTRSTAEVYR
ncbi:MAG: chitobiase/beta-hexosaminidase C-terminal domain-containing protein [bacterium]|nr:MAG: chitobiase/beta-hexosaminidase C-terminal domain-containing protein [bacterium]